MIALFMDYAKTFWTLSREVGISDKLKCDWFRAGLRSWLNTKIVGFMVKDFDGLEQHAR
jgi:hypothetical protein